MAEQNTDSEDLKPSKSQRKRDMQAVKVLAEKLASLSSDQLSTLDMPDIVDAIEQAKRITKGNARKRQIQHVTKLLSRTDTSRAKQLIDELDASSAAHIQKFHQLEIWREKLLEDDQVAMTEIVEAFPSVDRQQMRQIVRAAIKEKNSGDERVEYRKLFQFLKSLSE